MIAVVQRVTKSSVHINDELFSEIHSGLNVLVCVTENDEINDVYYLADKIVKLRIFSDLSDKMNLSLIDIKGEMLVISQFTLAADTKKGNRPSFINAASSKKGEELYRLFIEYIKSKYDINVKTGKFAAKMSVHIINEGPVTIIIDSKVNKRK
ncbi:MAG: D-aminoacyl-tRNA deacylase [Clostridia bacterium]|jgi:D-tyrosyl-tRNA(Tyr) deacylase